MSDSPLPPPSEAASPSDEPRRRSSVAAPNYLMRRAIAIGVIVAVLVGTATVVGWYIGRDDGGHDPVDVDPDWDVVAVIEPTNGDVTVTDPDRGDVIEEISTDIGRVRGSLLIDSTLVIVGAQGQVGVDLSNSTEAIDLDPDDTLTGAITLSRPEGSDRTALLADGSGNVVLVHERPDDPISTSDLIELPRVRLDATSARANPDGRAVLFPDVGNFQSVLVHVDADEPVYFPGVPLAVDDDRVATVLNVGAEAQVTISSHDGEVQTEFTTDTIAAAMLVEDGLLTISTDGEVARVIDGESTRLGTLSGTPNAAQSWVMISGDRLVVTTEAATDVLDTDGMVVNTIALASPITDGDEPWRPSTHHALCLAATSDVGVQLVDARADVRSTPADDDGELFVRADGCQGLIVANGTALTIATDPDDPSGPTLELGGELVALSPDGATAAVEDGPSVILVPTQPPDADQDGDTEEPEEPVVVADAGSIVYLAPT